MNARLRRLSALVGIMGFGLLTAGCETSDILDKMHDFNPFGTAKTPLPGERRAVFPEGVPGVQQGVPPELMRGAQGQAALEPEPAPEPPKPAPRRTERPKPKPRVAQPRPPRPAPAAEPAETQQSAPARSRPAPQPASAPPPAAAAPWTPPPQQPAPTVWPDPPKAGQFSR